MRISTELTIEMRYKLRMLGVPIDGPGIVLVDNESVAIICPIPFIILKNKYNPIAYHQVRVDISAGLIIMAHIPVKSNPDNLLTNPIGTH